MSASDGEEETGDLTDRPYSVAGNGLNYVDDEQATNYESYESKGTERVFIVIENVSIWEFEPPFAQDHVLSDSGAAGSANIWG